MKNGFAAASLILGLMFGGCDEPPESLEPPLPLESESSGSIAPQPETSPSSQATPAENTNTADGTTALDNTPAQPDESDLVPSQRERAVPENAASDTSYPSRAIGTTVTRGDSDTVERLTRSTLLRLYASVGGPTPTFHGRAIRLADNDDGSPRFAALVSAVVAVDGGVELNMRLWSVVLSASEATIESELRLPVVHTLEYHAVAVGGEPEGLQVLRFVSEDVDLDGEPEVQIVVESGVAVLCGLGEIMARRLFYVNSGRGKPFTFAAQVLLRDFAGSGDMRRATTRLSDENGDGHPDLLVRTRECANGEFIGECPHESVEVERHFWDAELDRWSEVRDSPGVQPCDGE